MLPTSMPTGLLRPLHFCLLLLVLSSACALSPREQLSASAGRYQMQEREVRSSRFSHLLFQNFTRLPSGELNVYLEGDGVPWILRFFRSPDPTPRSALMLTLMARDPMPALYLGRPCYNEKTRSKGCDPKLWTSGRYSAVVVDSMAAVLEQQIERLGVRSVNLFGHSGGGTLALLLAERIAAVKRVVTLAGNINIDAWTSHHGYSRLYTSMNPAARLALPQRIEQIHLLGANDRNIPPALNRDWILQQVNSYGVVFDGFDHICCWSRIWAETLQTLHGRPPYRFAGQVFKQPPQ